MMLDLSCQHRNCCFAPLSERTLRHRSARDQKVASRKASKGPPLGLSDWACNHKRLAFRPSPVR